MKKIILLATTFMLVAIVNAQTPAGRKAGGAQQEYLPGMPTKKSAEKVKKVEPKKSSNKKSTSGIRADILKQGIGSATASYAWVIRRMPAMSGSLL